MNSRDRPPLPALDPLRTVPIVLIALFIVLAAVDLLLALQPALLRSLRASWESFAPSGRPGSPLPTLLAATGAISGIALSATLVAAFIRAVRRAPFTWLTPSLIGLWSVLISGVTSLPLPISAVLFAGASALLLAGGGVLLQQRAPGRAWLGGLLLLMPLVLLVAAYAARGSGFDRDAQLLIVSQILICCALWGVALVTRSRLDPVRSESAAEFAAEERLAASGRRGDEARANGLEARLRDALINVASSEARALQAESRARGAEQRAQDAEQRAQDAELAAAEPGLLAFDGDGPGARRARRSHGTVVWFSMLWLGAAASVGYFLLYTPMQKRLLAQQGLIRRATEQREREIAALQARFDQERGELAKQRDQLNTQLDELRQQSTQPAQSKAATSSHASDNSTDSNSSSERASSWRARRAARLQAAAAEAAGDPAASPPPIAHDSQESSAPEPPPKKPSNARGDDDPIGGLDL